MQFQILGPLRVNQGNMPISLGGTKRRATLGFLLLQANQVVPTSHLVTALWPSDEAPVSARKILQNAVCGLRNALSVADRSHDSHDSVRLLTQAPGYVLQVGPDQVDLFQFRQLADAGRAALAAGEPARAAELLSEALALWQGDALVDLVEAGIHWPELTAVQNERQEMLEDYFDAELGSGNHHIVLPTLESMVQADPLRERVCGQLMLALYRCERQADALNVYARTRSLLIEQLGLEPGRALQSLQHNILTHDAALTLVAPPQSTSVHVQVVDVDVEISASPHHPPAPVAEAAEAVVLEQPVAYGPLSPVIAQPADSTESLQVVADTGITRYREVSVVLVRVQPCIEVAGATPVVIDRVLEGAKAIIREQVEAYGGTPVTSIGSVSLCLFDADHEEWGPLRAVQAGQTIRDMLSPPAAVGILASAAVATGKAMLRYDSPTTTAPGAVTGAIVEECEAILASAEPGEIRVCDRTRSSTEPAISYRGLDGAGRGWPVAGNRHRSRIVHRAVPIVDRECELDMMGAMLMRMQHRRTPHMITVLGERGVGKTRLVMEFERRVLGMPNTPRFLVGRVPARWTQEHQVVADTVRAYCGIGQTDPGWAVNDKLMLTVQRITTVIHEREWLLARLRPALLHHWEEHQISAADVLAGWRRLLTLAAAERPLVLVIDDAHLAEDMLLSEVHKLAEPVTDTPLLVVVSARLELLRRRPTWSGGRQQAVTVTLDRLSGAAVNRAMEFITSTMDDPVRASLPALTVSRRAIG